MSRIKIRIFLVCFFGMWNVAVGAESSLSSAKSSGWLDVTRFGAVPDDKGNDSDAIRKAISAAANQNGGTVYLPHGVYLINKPLRIHASGIVVTGDGKSTVLKNNGCKDAIIRSLSSGRKKATSLEEVIIEKMTIDGVDKTVTGILAAGFTRGCVIRDMCILRCLDGIFLSSDWSLSIERNHILLCSGTGLRIGAATRTIAGDDGEKRLSHRGTTVGNAINVIGNTVTDCDYGIWWRGGSGWFVGGNTFECNQHNAYFQNTWGGAIIGNYFESSRSGAALLRLGHSGGCGIPKNLFVAGNTFNGSDTYYCIQIDSLWNSDIMANRFEGKMLNIPYKGDTNRIKGNKIFVGKPPKKSDSFGVSGQMVWDKDYFYICVGNRQWKRVRLERW